jgi:uncharacterized protein YycO
MVYEKIKNIKYKKLLIFAMILVLIFIVIQVMNAIIEPQGYFNPDYDKINILPILNKKNFSENDYKELLYQTGLGETAIDEIMKEQDGIDKILEFQEDFFRNNNTLCKSIGIITSQESIVNSNGKAMYGFKLAPYENGYVLITKATHSIGWRHGHAAIITDAEKEETLEAILLGSNSQLQNINKWRVYPSFIMLKLKDTSQDTLDAVAAFAKNNLADIPYGLTVGLTSKKNPKPENISSTQCSHLVWYPFMQYGYDVDSDGSWLVTPKDIANSDLFEVVQIHGVNPKEIWP